MRHFQHKLKYATRHENAGATIEEPNVVFPTIIYKTA